MEDWFLLSSKVPKELSVLNSKVLKLPIHIENKYLSNAIPNQNVL